MPPSVFASWLPRRFVRSGRARQEASVGSTAHAVELSNTLPELAVTPQMTSAAIAAITAPSASGFQVEYLRNQEADGDGR